jgi:HK97 gp10 family phage protein
MMEPTFDIEGLPELNARLDKIATVVAGPIVREALQAGGKIIKDAAVENVRRKTGALASDVIIVTRMREEGLEKYVLIGPGWDPNAYRRVARNRRVGNREVASADQSTNPGVYGYFLEVGHRAPGQGLAHNPQFKRDQAAARKQGKKVDTSKYGHLTTPPYPWLGPAVESERDAAIEAAAEVIEKRLAEQGL